MSLQNLSVNQVKDLFIFVASNLVASKDLLTQADQVIGDGDHGIGMARGFEKVGKILQDSQFSSIQEIFKTIGDALLSTIGGASGAVFGSFFIGASNGLKEVMFLDSKSLAVAIVSGLDQVKKRGGARIGDKTMIDALEPASITAQNQIGNPLNESIKNINLSAKKGMEKTKKMIARIGKAKTLGERSLGYVDPGAISISLIFHFMDEFISKLQ